MKLELKHLAPYLPYGLKMKLLNFPFDGHIRILELDCGHDFHFYLQNNYVRPFLRPLSDLTKEIEVNGERFVPVDWLEDKYYTLNYREQCERLLEQDGEHWINQSDYMLIEQLIEWHFDFQGLIEAGLAIDLNTVK